MVKTKHLHSRLPLHSHLPDGQKLIKQQRVSLHSEFMLFPILTCLCILMCMCTHVPFCVPRYFCFFHTSVSCQNIKFHTGELGFWWFGTVRIEPRALCMRGQDSTTELQPQLCGWDYYPLPVHILSVLFQPLFSCLGCLVSVYRKEVFNVQPSCFSFFFLR